MRGENIFGNITHLAPCILLFKTHYIRMSTTEHESSVCTERPLAEHVKVTSFEHKTNELALQSEMHSVRARYLQKY